LALALEAVWETMQGSSLIEELPSDSFVKPIAELRDPMFRPWSIGDPLKVVI